MSSFLPYDYVNYKADVQSLIHVINLQGKDLVGLELGVFSADSFCTMLQNCPSIKTLHGIDHWKPYDDYLFTDQNNRVHSLDLKKVELNKLLTYHNIKYSGHEHKAVIHEMDSNDAVHDFSDEYFDFMFIDTYLTEEQAYNDFVSWYPKLKRGGLLMGHDWDSNLVRRAVENFRTDYDINSIISVFDSAFVWRKE